MPGEYVVMEWLTNDRGRLQKTVVRDFRTIERLIEKNGWQGWGMASEVANMQMHKIIEKVGGVPVNRDDKYVYFASKNRSLPCAV